MKKSLTMVAIAALTFASCSKEANTPSNSNIKLESSVAATRAVVDHTTYNFTATLVGDNGALYASETATIKNGVEITTGLPYELAKTYKFYAVAPSPAVALATDKATAEITIDGTKDVMYAATGSFTANTDMANRKLSFNHMLTQLQFQIKAENQAAVERWGTVTSVSVIDQPSILTMDVVTGDLTAGTTLVPFTTVNNIFTPTTTYEPLTGSEPVIMTMPTAPAAETFLLVKTSLVRDGVVAKIIAPASGFEKGKSHVISLTLNAAIGIILEAPTVVAWDNNGDPATDVAIN